VFSAVQPFAVGLKYWPAHCVSDLFLVNTPSLKASKYVSLTIRTV
jgi:hypothetical protein